MFNYLTSAVVCAAGYGSLVKGVSKLTALISGQPMITHVVKRVLDCSFIETVYVVVNPLYDQQIQAALFEGGLSEQDLGRIKFIRQERRTGAAGALALVLPSLTSEETVLVTFGDMPLWTTETFSRLIEMHRDNRDMSPVISMVTVQVPAGHAAHKYGRVLRDRTGRITSVIEPGDGKIPEESLKDVASVNPSLYLFDTRFLSLSLPKLTPHTKTDGFGAEYQLPDLVTLASHQRDPVLELPVDDLEQTLGVNTLKELKEVCRIFESHGLFDPAKFSNGALISESGFLTPQRQYRDCPACCIGPYCRDGDVELFINTTTDNSFWQCGYTFVEEQECGFRYPADWAENDPRIEALAKIRRSFLRKLREAAYAA